MTGAQRNNAIRKALAETYPDVTFTVAAQSPSGRNNYTNLSISWLGGPLADQIRDLVQPLLSWRDKVAFGREMTEDEWSTQRARREEEDARREAERPAREAARAAQIAENRKLGAEKRTRTAQAKRDLEAKLAESFPGVEFAITTDRGDFALEWTGGPSLAEVSQVHDSYRKRRHQAPEEVQAERNRLAAELREKRRLIPKLEAMGVTNGRWPWDEGDDLSQMLAAYQRASREARRLARTLHFLSGRKFVAAPRNPRPEPAQLRLPIALPVWMFAIPKQTRLASQR